MPGPNHLENLGRRLRALRVAAGLAGKELAADLGWPASKVSRIELARQNASPADVDAWVTATRGTDDERTRLLGLLDQAREDQNTFRQRSKRGQAPVQAGYNALVQSCTRVREFHTTVIPGLLQTPDYARAILTAATRFNPVPDVEDAVATRMERQQYLYSPRRFEFVVAEPVLRWGIAPPDVMRAQLDRLQSAIGLPNVRLGILPLGVALDFVPLHTFEIYDELVCVETMSREHRHAGAEARTYLDAFKAIQAAAVTGDDARQLLLRVASDLA